MSTSGFTKLCSSIVTSTIWQESKETKILWITMLAMSDRHGVVQGSIPGLAKMAGLTVPETEASLLDLYAPDPYSRTKDHEGRRICDIQGGWVILNYEIYRKVQDEETRREQLREAKARQRLRDSYGESEGNCKMSSDVNNVNSGHKDASASASVSEGNLRESGGLGGKGSEGEPPAPKRIPTLVEWLAESKSVHPDWPEADARQSWEYYESLGWKRGKTPVVKWKLCISTCYRNWIRYHPPVQQSLIPSREVPAG